MIGVDEADQLALASSRYHHMQRVSCLMGEAARQLDADLSLWRLVGLLHDLDYDSTEGNRDKHGLLAAQMLDGKLSEEGLDAIRCHDHRTGLKPQTDLDYSLILCDAVSLIIEELGRGTPIGFDNFKELSDNVAMQKPWLKRLVFENPLLDRIDLGRLLESE